MFDLIVTLPADSKKDRVLIPAASSFCDKLHSRLRLLRQPIFMDRASLAVVFECNGLKGIDPKYSVPSVIPKSPPMREQLCRGSARIFDRSTSAWLARANKFLADDNKTFSKSRTYISVNRRDSSRPSGVWAKLFSLHTRPEGLDASLQATFFVGTTDSTR
jgi:hypothetical protein